MARMLGKIAWFNNVKGFGFITHEGGPDVFCHIRAIEKEGCKPLGEGETVEFEIVQDERGPRLQM